MMRLHGVRDVNEKDITVIVNTDDIVEIKAWNKSWPPFGELKQYYVTVSWSHGLVKTYQFENAKWQQTAIERLRGY